MIAPNIGALQHRAPQVGRRGVREERRPERAERRAVDERRDDAAEDAEQQRVDVEQARDEHQRQEARDDEVLDRVDAEHLQRVELLADLAGAEVGGDRRAGDAGETIAVTNGANSRIDASTKKPPRRSSAPNRTRKFAACRPGRAVAERDRRDRAAGTSTAAARTGTARRTRRRTGTAAAGQRRSSCPSGSSCRRPLRAGSSSGGTPDRRRCEPRVLLLLSRSDAVPQRPRPCGTLREDLRRIA